MFNPRLGSTAGQREQNRDSCLAKRHCVDRRSVPRRNFGVVRRKCPLQPVAVGLPTGRAEKKRLRLDQRKGLMSGKEDGARKRTFAGIWQAD